MCCLQAPFWDHRNIALIVTDEPSSFWPFSDLFFKETNHAWFSSSGTQLKLCGKKESSSDCLSYQQQMRAVAKFEKSGEEAKTSHGTTAVLLRRWKSSLLPLSEMIIMHIHGAEGFVSLYHCISFLSDILPIINHGLINTFGNVIMPVFSSFITQT